MKRTLLLYGTAIFLMYSASYAMQMRQQLSDNVMVSINKNTDVAPFAGRMVAYTATFGKGYSIENAPDLKYGYINEQMSTHTTSIWVPGVKRRPLGERGYSMAQVLKPEEVASEIALTDSKLKDASLQMRLVTPDEFSKIYDAVKGREAKLHSDRAQELRSLEGARKKLSVRSLFDISMDNILQQIKSGKKTLEDFKTVLPFPVYEELERRYFKTK